MARGARRFTEHADRDDCEGPRGHGTVLGRHGSAHGSTQPIPPGKKPAKNLIFLLINI